MKVTVIPLCSRKNALTILTAHCFHYMFVKMTDHVSQHGGLPLHLRENYRSCFSTCRLASTSSRKTRFMFLFPLHVRKKSTQTFSINRTIYRFL